MRFGKRLGGGTYDATHPAAVRGSPPDARSVLRTERRVAPECALSRRCRCEVAIGVAVVR